MKRSIEVQVLDQRLVLDNGSVLRCLDTIGKTSPFRIPDGSLAVTFVDESECSRLHAAFFNDPEITDVMTFPGDPDDDHAGDIAICPAMAAEACNENEQTFEQELTLYLVHACLHLAGLDDRDEHSRREMRQAESILMERISEASAELSGLWNVED